MEELQYGPNGGLIYCMEFLMNNMDWLEDEVGSYSDDYLIIDCPGQIELYTHFDIMKRLVEALGRLNIAICGVYLLESVRGQSLHMFLRLMNPVGVTLTLTPTTLALLSNSLRTNQSSFREY